ncbi:MAG TPA: hypothetical protein VLJ10_01930 [Candidatus Bathyarchaeia archaeon]|nr:hypothetical protein [Candidatus Bathyarchaeia archaeon]
MSFEKFMEEVRRLDNHCARWMLRHFYTMFFQVVLVVVFFFFFVNTIQNINLSDSTDPTNLTHTILLQQTNNLLLIIFLLLLNSFWMLFIFNNMNRLRIILKDIHYTLLRKK